MQQSRLTSKADIKKVMIRLLEKELNADLSHLSRRVDIDITCDTAVDSLNMVNIVADLESDLGVKIEDGDIVPSRMRSLEKFADFLADKIAANGAVAGPARNSAP